MRRVFVGLLVVFTACTGSDGAGSPSPGPSERLLEDSSAECPALPPGESGTGEFVLWPDELAGDLVPVIDAVCATPTAPHLFGLLNEQAGWTAGDLDAAALGILHRGHEPVATFTAFRVSEETPGLDEVSAQLETSGAAVTTVGDMELGWGRVAGHVHVYFVAERDLVLLFGEREADAVDALTTWLDDATVTAPRDIPELGTLPPALGAGPPLAGLPDGYTALEMDAVSFMASDFADAVTIHDEEGIEALGAAVVLRDGGEVVGTLVAGSGPGMAQLADWGDEFTKQDVPAAGLSARQMGAFVVGYDQADVDLFVDAWQKELEG